MIPIPFRTFIDWAFDGSENTPIPKKEVDSVGNVITPDILKASGPLNQRYVISMFMKNPKMCLYLNKYFNNMNLWYLDKKTLFLFLKKCIIDFKARRSDLVFIKSKRSKDKLAEKLSDRFPLLTIDELRFLTELIENSEQRDSIYHSFGMKKPSKRKIKKEKKKRKTGSKTSVKNFLKKNFEVITT